MFDKIAKILSENSNYSYEACLYILRTYTHLFLSLILILILAYILNILTWASIIIIVYMGLRSFSGGAHSQSKILCSTISTIIPIGGGLIIKYISFSNMITILLTFLVSLVSLVVLIKYAPADTPEKPIISLTFKKQLKRNSIIFLLVMQSIIILLYLVKFKYFNQVSFSMLIGLLCQILLILPFGYDLLKYLDSVF